MTCRKRKEDKASAKVPKYPYTIELDYCPLYLCLFLFKDPTFLHNDLFEALSCSINRWWCRSCDEKSFYVVDACRLFSRVSSLCSLLGRNNYSRKLTGTRWRNNIGSSKAKYIVRNRIKVCLCLMACGSVLPLLFFSYILSFSLFTKARFHSDKSIATTKI